MRLPELQRLGRPDDHEPWVIYWAHRGAEYEFSAWTKGVSRPGLLVHLVHEQPSVGVYVPCFDPDDPAEEAAWRLTNCTPYEYYVTVRPGTTHKLP